MVTIGRMLAARAAIVGLTQNGNGCIDSMGLKRRLRVLVYGVLYKIPLQGLGLGYRRAWVNGRSDESSFSLIGLYWKAMQRSNMAKLGIAVARSRCIWFCASYYLARIHGRGHLSRIMDTHWEHWRWSALI